MRPLSLRHMYHVNIPARPHTAHHSIRSNQPIQACAGQSGGACSRATSPWPEISPSGSRRKRRREITGGWSECTLCTAFRTMYVCVSFLSPPAPTHFLNPPSAQSIQVLIHREAGAVARAFAAAPSSGEAAEGGLTAAIEKGVTFFCTCVRFGSLNGHQVI